MANSVDLVIGSEAIKQVESLISKLSLAEQRVLGLSGEFFELNKNIVKTSTPSGLENIVTSAKNVNTQLEKQNAIITKLHADIAKKAEQSRLAEIRLQQAREKAFDSFEKNAQKEQAIANKNASAYNKTQTQINTLTKAYNDLAVRKERYNNLTANEEMRLQTLSRVNEKYNGILKATDATIGKNQRNVGNYASGYNALGNSINQLSREAPAFANSVNTGFMALSNNFPALFDAINGIRDKNKMLVEEGKPTVSVLKSIAGAVFSWQSILSVGVTLLTIYGAKLIDYAFNTDEAKKSVDALNKSHERNDDLMKIASNNIDHQITLQKELLKQQGKSQSEINDLDVKGAEMKLKNAERIRDVYQGQIEEVNKYKDAVKKGNEEAYFSELLKQVGSGRIAKEQARIRVNSENEVLAVIVNNLNKAENQVKEAGFKLSELNASNKTKEVEENKKASSEISKEEEDRLKAISELRKKELELELAKIDQKLNNEDSYYSDRLTALDADFLKRIDIAKLDYDEEFRLSKGNQDKQKTALINFQLEKIKLIESYNKQKNSLEALDLDPVTKLATSKSEAKDPFSSVVESGKKAGKSLEDVGKKAEETKKRILELGVETSNWLGSFSSEFLQNSGFGSLETFFDGTFEKLLAGAETTQEKFAVTFNAIAESAQEAFNFISNASQQNFDAEKQRIEDQQKIAISYAGGSEVAIAKINEDAEKRKKDIANRENKAKQKQAIFNIAIDTAQAIMATVGKTGFAGLPLALILGALGAAQIAMVASQKIPQYFDGTDNHIGGIMLVNDGAGSNYQEKVILPNGKEIMPEGRNVLMNAPKGTKVLTHEQQIMQMLNERGISVSAKYNQSNGMTAQEMDGVMSKHFSKIQTNNTTFDKNGFRSWSEKNGNRTIQNNNRVSRTGFKI